MRKWKINVAVASLVPLVLLATSACSGTATNGGDRTLTVWSYGADSAQSGFQKLTKDLDAKFESANPGVKVDHVFYPLDGYDTRIQAATAASSGPDVAFQYDDRAWESTLPLDDLLKGDLGDQVLIANGAITNATDGLIHTIPWGVYPGVFLFNRQLFESAGLDPDSPPTTFADFLVVCDALNSSGVVPMAYGFKDQYTLMRLVASITAQTGDGFPAWASRSTPYTVGWYKAAVQDIVTMADRGCFGDKPWLADSNIVADPEFRAGNTAITFPNNSFTVDDYESTIGSGNLGIFGQPIATGSSASEPSIEADPANGIQIFKWTQEEQLAKDYISFYLSADSQAAAWDQIKQVPNNSKATVTSESPVYDKLLALAASPKVQPGYWPVGTEEGDAYFRSTAAVVSGDMTINEFLTSMQELRAQLAK